MNIHDSLQSLLRRRDIFGTTFYDVFFRHCPEAQPHFAGVNLAHQAVLITLALTVIEGHYSQHYPATALYLQYLGHKHHLRGVPVELYPKFGEALLIALERFHGGDWDEEAARQWQEAILGATERMLLGYREPVHV